MEKNRSGGETLLESREGGVGRRCPEVGTQSGGEVSEGSSYLAIIPDELAVEVEESEEALELLTGRALAPLDNRLDLTGVRPGQSSLHYEPQELHGWGMEGAFLYLEIEAVLQETLDDHTNMLDVLLNTPGEHQHVIKVQDNEYVQHVIHEGLKDGGGVGEAEGHDEVLVVTPGSLEGGLPFIPLSDAHKMVSVPEVQQDGAHEGERIFVFNGDVVQ